MKELLPSRPYDSSTVRLRTGCGSLYLTLVYNEAGIPIKVFLQLGKAGGCVKAHLSILSEHINTALDTDLKEGMVTVARLTGIKCSESSSCVDATVRFLEQKLSEVRRTNER
jgi:hypothetical protein